MIKGDTEKTLNFKEAFKCANFIAGMSKVPMNYSLAQFKDEFPNLDFDGDGEVSVQEMVNFELKRIH